ncbi:hypothetical protein [Flavobacterium humi]|uniref:Lipoprotein n=1 Tax=Flavobacterium humi TaxID=2562683 RepID=A0A4Z0L4K2_9FLAO|nr:hypothetical protein [Flavobacterium humi]TGD56886.1 hypothetical protein E4635_13905 [Flavobacterium humi]
MKKAVFLLFSILSLTSCTFTEDIYINPDGSGKYTLDMDGSSMMAMVPKDSVRNEKSIDSVFSFKEVFAAKKDSIAKLSKEEQEKLKKLENFNMRMKMDYKAQQFLFSMNTDFKNVTELQDAMANMNAFQSMGKNKVGANAMASPESFGNNNSILKYSYNGKKFTRKAVIDKSRIKKVENDSLAESYKMIYASSKYVIKYHFPKPVKSISNTAALFSEDRKTVTIEYPFNEYMDAPEKLNFEVEFTK